MKKNNPGCRCCGCLGWHGDPPDELQLTLPAGCERAGTHVLDRDDTQDYVVDCPTSTIGGFASICAAWVLFIGTGDAQDTIIVNVGRLTSGGSGIIAGVCNQNGAALGTDAGTIWGMVTAISDWDDLDGVILPFTNRVTDTEGMADCSTDDDAEITFVP